MSTLKIRASMLPAYNDCARRAAARQWRRIIEAAGFQLRETLPSIGAAVGTATHAVAEDYLRAKLDGTEAEFQFSQAVDSAMATLQEETSAGCEWDDSTPRLDVAKEQITRMARILIHERAANIKPLFVEYAADADIDDGFTLTGRIDLVAEHSATGVALVDWKTGAVSRSHHAQLGAYSLLYRTVTPDGLPSAVERASIEFVKRTPRTRPQDSVVETVYPVALCEQTAWSTIHRIKRDMSDFTKTGNPDAFAENPMSMMCSATYCPAHGTEFCPITKHF
jgi:hypothetical protein